MSKAERVQLDHVLVDVDFFDKPKVIALSARYGHVATLFLLNIMATLSKATDAEMDVWGAYGLGVKFNLSLEQTKEIISYLVKQEMLTVIGDTLTQRRVAEDQEKCAAARKRKADNQKNYRDRQRGNNVTDNETHAESVSPVTDTVTDTEDLNTKKEDQPPAPNIDPASDGLPRTPDKAHTPPTEAGSLSQDPPGSIRPGPFKLLRFDAIQYEALQINEGPEVLARQIELWEAHTDRQKHKDRQRYHELCLEALSGKACLMSWAKSEAYRQLNNEKAAKTRAEKASAPYQKPAEAPRPQPKQVPKPEPPKLSEEARLKGLEQLREATRKIKGIAA